VNVRSKSSVSFVTVSALLLLPFQALVLILRRAQPDATPSRTNTVVQSMSAIRVPQFTSTIELDPAENDLLSVA
jgi:hypothetical protein